MGRHCGGGAGHRHGAQHDHSRAGRVGRRDRRGRTRTAGAASGWRRKKLTQTDATLLSDLRGLVEPTTRGDPQAPLLWTSRSLRNLADALQAMGHRISHYVVADLLRELNYSLQSNRKTREGSNNPDRDAQFGYINAKVTAALAAGEPAISVDTKKKEMVGDFKNAGRELRPKGNPEAVRVHDFKIPNWDVPHRMASMTSPAIPAGSASASITIPQALPSRRSDAGGKPWGAAAIRRQAAC